MQVSNPVQRLVQVAEPFLLAEALPEVFVEALQEGLVDLALRHATNVAAQTITLATARLRL